MCSFISIYESLKNPFVSAQMVAGAQEDHSREGICKDYSRFLVE